MRAAPLLLGLYSSVPACGKTTCSLYLLSKRFETKSFAGAVKSLCCDFLHRVGVDPLEVNRYIFQDKNEIIPELGVTGRHLQQTLATEWGRNCVQPDVWVNIWKYGTKKALDAGFSVISDDVRFLNEAQAIKQMRGFLIRIDRPSASVPEQNHISDGGLEDYNFDYVISNTGSFKHLYCQLEAIIDDITYNRTQP